MQSTAAAADKPKELEPGGNYTVKRLHTNRALRKDTFSIIHRDGEIIKESITFDVAWKVIIGWVHPTEA